MSGLPERQNADPGEVTRLLRAVETQSPGAAEQLVELVRDDLRWRAEARLAGAPPWRTLDPTALVHEAYIRLFHTGEPSWINRGHFFMAATRAMHDIVVERARRAGARKRGRDYQRIPLGPDLAGGSEEVDAIALDEILRLLEERWPRRADIVRLKFYGGMTEREIAQALGSSPATVRREWAAAKAWLLSKLSHESEDLV